MATRADRQGRIGPEVPTRLTRGVPAMAAFAVVGIGLLRGRRWAGPAVATLIFAAMMGASILAIFGFDAIACEAVIRCRWCSSARSCSPRLASSFGGEGNGGQTGGCPSVRSREEMT